MNPKAEFLTGFFIKFYNESDEQEVLRKAERQAKRLADLLSFMSERRVTPTYLGFSKKVPNIPGRWETNLVRGFSYDILKGIELDLTDNVIVQRIQNDDGLTHRLHHASLALGAEELRLYAYMFTELFQVIEEEDDQKKKTIPDYLKYSALRDVLSHRPLDPNRAMKWVQHHYPPPYNFEFIQPTPNNYEFNFNSEKNMKQLEAEAKKLKGIAMSYLSTRV